VLHERSIFLELNGAEREHQVDERYPDDKAITKTALCNRTIRHDRA
jgi:hypothetical protein